MWSLPDQGALQKVVEDFRDIDALYIADGHHRSAAASRVRASRGKANTTASSHHEDCFLAVIFPHDELNILPYNRVVRDLNGLTPKQFLDALARHYEMQTTSKPGDAPPAGFDMYLEGQWHRATPKPDQDQQSNRQDDPVRTLAITVLTEGVLDPLLGIKDQRSDPRIDFVGGVRGPEELAAMVDREEGRWRFGYTQQP